MTGTKGWNELNANGLPRATAWQLREAKRTALAALSHNGDAGRTEQERLLYLLALDRVEAAFAAYPVDRSCFTCDYFGAYDEAYCARWDDDVPATNRETGCDEHKAEGAPF